MSKTSSPRVVSTDEAGTVLATFVPSAAKEQNGSEHTRIDIVRPDRGVKGLLQTLLDVFLPAGYPHSVTEDYLEYQIYDSLQAFTSSIAGLLSSRAVLESTGFNDPTATTTSAILLSIFQESLGRLTTILFAHRLGTSLEPECKTYRLLADIFNDGAMVLECLSPIFPRIVRVMILATASAGKALCGVAAGASKGCLSKGFARWGNLGEVSAKDASQETVISLLGMWAGSIVVTYIRSRTATWTALLALLATHLYLNYRAVRAVQMTTLNRQRAGLVFGSLLDRGTLLSPAEVKEREKVFERDGVIRDSQGRVLGFAGIGVSFEEYLSRIGRCTGGTSFAVDGGGGTTIGAAVVEVHTDGPREEMFLLHLDERSRHVSIALRRDSTVKDQLEAWYTACLALRLLRDGSVKSIGSGKEDAEEKSISSGTNDSIPASIVIRARRYSAEAFSDILRQLVEAGWDVETAALETRRATRYAFVTE